MDRRLVFGGAALLLLMALVGVLAFTGGEADATPLAYDVEWPVEPGPATLRSDELEEGRNDSYDFELDRQNVTQVTVQLDWEDDVGRPDQFRLEVTPPNGTPVANTSRNETINLTFPLQEVPGSTVVEATNRSQARDRLAEEATSAGQGTWQARISLEDAPGRRPVSEAPQLETEPDGANSYNLTFAHRSFYAELGDPGPPEPDG